VKQLVVLCVLGWIGCGGGSETPVDKCNDLINDLCDRGVQCAPQETGTHVNCIQQLLQQLPCGSTKQVSATYDSCVQQIKGDACQVLFPADPQTGEHSVSLPTDCNGVILMFEPGAQTPTIGGSPFQRASQLSTISAE
jgi:hypothetical protein